MIDFFNFAQTNFCDVKITIIFQNELSKIPILDWLSRLILDMSNNYSSTYNIKVVTSDKKFAGTEAKVYIELLGKNARSGVVFLESSHQTKKTFEQGKTDSFDVNCKNVGALTKIR